MDADINIPGAFNLKAPRRLDPKECEHARPYMVDNGVLDVYICRRFSGTCYFEPNGGKQFKKICEEAE